ncbi:hypothetical protein PCC7418_0363 [Halothece sp. PCC 7418]|uniref:hypothetical protein n=1 Tax=Halothece sp. (strain PCC 7418) TaxID=65093 RepID=UPI0002A085E5|nr:hypothetical protein [Halothece sp. PCC 7418]AFZ42597.1 hypothetical protein PCC7418_0363 [Halothece sp. PCC 7418]
MLRHPLKFLNRMELALERFFDTSARTIPVIIESSYSRLNIGEVIYGQGWNAPYQVVSGSFNRIYYFRWRGHLVSACADPPNTVNYYLKRLGGQQIIRLHLKPD